MIIPLEIKRIIELPKKENICDIPNLPNATIDRDHIKSSNLNLKYIQIHAIITKNNKPNYEKIMSFRTTRTRLLS